MVVAIIDVNEPNVKIYAHILARIDDLRVKHFTSPDAALLWCEHNEPDLLILDYRMPPRDGLEFIREFTRVRPGGATPIVMITGETDRAIRHKALELGVSDFLNKPADPVEFLARVRNLLALRDSRKKLENHAASLAEEVARATKDIADREQETINRLTRAAESRDNETGLHIVRMGKYAELLGRTLDLTAEECRLLLLATPMHDIGKVSTPDGILLKQGPLSAAEWAIMKMHSRAGYDILAGSSSKVLQLAAQIALRHHERWDGSGYPDGMRGTQIPLAARIAMVGDVFDALISKRPYKRAWTIEEARTQIKKSSGTHFDPMIVEAMDSNWDGVLAIANSFADAAHAQEASASTV